MYVQIEVYNEGEKKAEIKCPSEFVDHYMSKLEGHEYDRIYFKFGISTRENLEEAKEIMEKYSRIPILINGKGKK